MSVGLRNEIVSIRINVTYFSRIYLELLRMSSRDIIRPIVVASKKRSYFRVVFL